MGFRSLEHSQLDRLHRNLETLVVFARPDRHHRHREGDLAAVVEKQDAIAREVAKDRQPQTNLPFLPLTPVRGGSAGGPVRVLTLPKEPGWVALWVEPGDTNYPAYRATLSNDRGTIVFQASRLALNDLGALLITVHSTSLSPGAYRLDVEGLPRTSGPVQVGRFPLRVAAR